MIRKAHLSLGSLWVVVIAVLCACPGHRSRGRADGIKQVIVNARKQGAYRCAPKELALAEAHLERGNDELDLGNLIPANDHLDVSEKNAQLALDLSQKGKCARTPTGKDSDNDGCMDSVDRCPNEAEDRDGFEDNDCCPDVDNDRDGIADADDACPNIPEDKDGFADEDGCPDLDNDGDGIAGTVDECPNDPEDWDGFKDEDGCPDDDNDADKIADALDACPDEPEDYDGDQDTDGCPDKYKLVVVTKTKIELKQTVYFATNKTRILPRSFPLLMEVAQALRDLPTIEVQIEGHTDSRASDTYNMKLSQGRAESVRAFLIRQGIEGERMKALGFGETNPIANNRTRTGRALNRRVEFLITKR